MLATLILSFNKSNTVLYFMPKSIKTAFLNTLPGFAFKPVSKAYF